MDYWYFDKNSKVLLICKLTDKPLTLQGAVDVSQYEIVNVISVSK